MQVFPEIFFFCPSKQIFQPQLIQLLETRWTLVWTDCLFFIVIKEMTFWKEKEALVCLSLSRSKFAFFDVIRESVGVVQTVESDHLKHLFGTCLRFEKVLIFKNWYFRASLESVGARL